MTSPAEEPVLSFLERFAHGAEDSAFDTDMTDLERMVPELTSLETIARLRSSLTLIRQNERANAVTERGLSYLIDTAHDLSKTLDFKSLIQAIVSRARSLVGANVVWVTVCEPGGNLRVMAAQGHLNKSTEARWGAAEHGLVSLIMKTKSFWDTQDYLNDTRFVHTEFLDNIVSTENIASLAGFPIMADDETFGFLFVADRYPRKLTGREISVLGSFASHAAVAMRNATTFARLGQDLTDQQHQNAALHRRVAQIESADAVLDEMTALLASDGTVDQFLQILAARVGGAVFLYDDALQMRESVIAERYRGTLALAYDTSSGDSAALASANTQSRRLGQSKVVVEGDGEIARVIAMQSGSGGGGALLVCHGADLDDIDVRMLERSAAVLSIARVWTEKRETRKLIASMALLRHLVMVSEPDPLTISVIKERLNLRPGGAVQLVQIVTASAGRAKQTSAIRAAAGQLDVLVDPIGDHCVCIGTPSALGAFLDRLSAPGGVVRGGGVISDPFTDLAEAPGHFTQVSRAVKVLTDITTLDRFLPQSQVSIFARLFEGGAPPDLARHMRTILKPLSDRPSRQQAEFKRTLLCYLDNQYNMTRTAETLGLHINTVRQRLATLQTLTGGWDDPIRALELHLALRLETLLEPASETDQRSTAEALK
jgi:GAF domain-containing protein